MYLFIDWNGVLNHQRFWSGCPWKSEINNYLFKKNRQVVLDWMRGKLSAYEVCMLISDHLFLDREEVYRSLVKSVLDFKIDDEILSLISVLKKYGHKIYIASDNINLFRDYVIKNLKLDDYFDGYCISCERKAIKGDVVHGNEIFYTPFYKRNGINPKDIIIFDDGNLENLCKYIGVKFYKVTKEKDLKSYLKEMVYVGT